MGKTVRHPPKKRSVPNGRQKTRSHGAPLLTPSDPARSERELASQLKMMGLYAHNTIGDGNCLFRALSDQLYGTPKEHWALRREICDHLLANPDRYEFFVDDDRPFADHVRVMRENGTYGGHLELTAFAHLKRRWIKVVQPGLVYVVSCEDESPKASASASSSSRRNGKGVVRPEDEDEDEEEEDDEDGANKDDPDEGSTCYLAYHNWEHWSSVRNINGPHTGPPKVREIPRASASRPSSPSPTPPPPLPSTDPSPTETLILNSLPPNSFSLETIRSTISSLGGVDAVSWERVVEVLLERQEEFVEGVSPVKRLDFLKRSDDDWRSASPVSSSSSRGGRGEGSGGEGAGDSAELLSVSMSTAKTLKPKSFGSSTPTSSFSSQDSSPASSHSSPPPPPPDNSQTTKLRFKRPPPASPGVVVAGKEKRAARKRRVSAAKLSTTSAAGGKDGRVTRSRVSGMAEESRVEGGFRELFI